MLWLRLAPASTRLRTPRLRHRLVSSALLGLLLLSHFGVAAHAVEHLERAGEEVESHCTLCRAADPHDAHDRVDSRPSLEAPIASLRLEIHEETPLGRTDRSPEFARGPPPQG